MYCVLRYIIRVLLIGSLGTVLFWCPSCESGFQLSVVTTKNGRISGLYDEATNVTQYRSIPYAQPPVGELRFRDPQPVQPWRGIRNGTEIPPACMQRRHPLDDRRPAKMSEDCLYLNIYVPGVDPEDSDRNYPVLVWLHGGDFIFGYNSYIDFSLLSNRGQLIVVSVGYRLDIFGFLSSGDERIIGNAGLLDQRVALEWIQQNVEYFGGDPSRITLYGESTGATCVYYHIASAGAKGLFSRAIIGGGVFIEGVDTQSTFRKVILSAKCDADVASVKNQTEEGMTEDHGKKDVENDILTIDQLQQLDPVRCLQSRSAQSLLELSMTLPHHSFVPVVDSHYVTLSLTKAFSFNPVQRRSFGVNCLIGVNSDGVPIRQIWNHNNRKTFLSRLDALAETRAHTKETIIIDPPMIDSNETECGNGELTRLTIRSKYYSDRKPYSRTLRDAYNGKYVSFIQAISEVMSSSPGSPLFLYYFTLKPSFVKTGDGVAARQTDELPFIFGNVLKDGGLNATSAERKLSEDMIKIWSSFIASGVPQLPNGIKWPPYETTNRTYVELNVNISADNVKQRLRENDRIFWNELIPKLINITSKPQDVKMNGHMMTTASSGHHHDGGSSKFAWGMSEKAVQNLLLALLIVLIFVTVICLTLVLILCKVRTIKLAAARHNEALKEANDVPRGATVCGNVNKAFANDSNKSKPESITSL